MTIDCSSSLSKAGYSLGPFLCNNTDCSIYYIYEKSNQNAKYLLKIMDADIVNLKDSLVVDRIDFDSNKIGLVYLISKDSLDKEGPDYFSYYNDECKKQATSEDTKAAANDRCRKSSIVFEEVEKMRRPSHSELSEFSMKTPMPFRIQKSISKDQQDILSMSKCKKIVRTPIPKNIAYVSEEDDDDDDDDGEDEDDDDEEEDDEDDDEEEDDEDEDEEEEDFPQISINKYDIQNKETLDLEQRVRRVSIAHSMQSNDNVKSILFNSKECSDTLHSGILTPPYNCTQINSNEHIKIESPHIFIPHTEKMNHVFKTPIPKSMKDAVCDSNNYLLNKDTPNKNENYTIAPTDYKREEGSPTMGDSCEEKCKFQLKMIQSSMLKRRRIKDSPI